MPPYTRRFARGPAARVGVFLREGMLPVDCKRLRGGGGLRRADLGRKIRADDGVGVVGISMLARFR